MMKRRTLFRLLGAPLAAPLIAADVGDGDLQSWVTAQGGEVEYDESERVVGIRFGFTWLADGDLDRIAGMQTLKRLDLSLTRVTDLGIERIRPLTGIEELNLYACEHISDTSLAHLRQWKNLRKLNLRGTDITDTGLAYIAAHKNLEVLDISVTQATDNGMEHLAELTKLRELNLGANKISALGLPILQLLPNLTTLRLSGQQMRNSGFWAVAVTDLDIDVVTQLTQLEHLDVAGRKLTDLGVKKIANLSRLRSLDLSRTEVTEGGIQALADLPQLQTLHLAGAERINDAAAPYLAAMDSLTSLDLSSTKVSDGTLRVLLKSHKLRELYLNGTEVTERGVKAFRSECQDSRVHWTELPAGE